MVLLAPPPSQAGGIIELEYGNPLVGERHRFVMHVCHYDPSTFAYVSGGPKTPSEAGIGATFTALGAVWSPYYPASWSLHLVACYFNSAGTMQPLTAPPTLAPIAGTSGSPDELGPATKRIFLTRSRIGTRRKVYLMQLLDGPVDVTADLTSTAGGLDGRDQALLAYLSSAGAGAVAPDGLAFAPRGTVRAWWDRVVELAPAGTGGGTGGGTSGMLTGPCLTFPLGASVCNPALERIELNTPSGTFAFDPSGITLPGGHRLETF